MALYRWVCFVLILIGPYELGCGNTRISGKVIRILEENQYVNSTIFSWEQMRCNRCLALDDLKVK